MNESISELRIKTDLEKALGILGKKEEQEDICGFCGETGADKIPHPVRWPGEDSAGTEFVHADCESEECRRAHAELSDDDRRRFLETL